MKQLISPLAGTAWRCLFISLGCLLTGAFVLILHLDMGLMPAATVQIATGLLLAASWVAAVWFLLLDSWGRWFWLVVLVGSAALVLAGGDTGMGFAIAFSVFLLTLRRYLPWRHISDRRRAVGFGFGVLALVFLVLTQRLWSLESASNLGRVGRNLGTWAVWSLGLFWAFSLFRLAINMRLHFLRLRSKLAVSGFLIGVVPVLAVMVLGFGVLYSVLGGARAARLSNTLDSWRDMTADGADLSGALYDTTFVWPGEMVVDRPNVVAMPAPEWVPVMSNSLRGWVANKSLVKRDSTGANAKKAAGMTDYFAHDNNLWLMRWSDLDTDAPAVQAWLVGHKSLREMSQILKVGLEVSASGTSTTDGGLVISTDDNTAGMDGIPDLKVSYRDTAESVESIMSGSMFFGGTFREVFVLDKEQIERANVFFRLRVGWPDLKSEFLGGGVNLNILVVVGLGVAAFLWLIIEIFAVFFGVRISEGIVAGVHALHRGTRAVAAGDLDTVIEIPNEDEFGDLAASFNEMTLAVRHGREIALANDRLKQEMETARSIQVRLLPSGEPRVLDFEVTGASIPSREIGGDYYDFLVQEDDKIGIAIGDVSGKGMPAALLMSNLQASLHGQVLHPGTVSGVVERVNDLIVSSTDPHMFATFFYGLLDATTATFTCTNAGHNPPLFLRTDGTIDELTTGGLLLGMLGDQPYKQDTVTMAPGEVIVLYTDGITEAVGPSAEEDDPEAMFGEEALNDVIRQNRHLPASAIKDAILDAVTAHTSGVAQSDDITLVVIRRQG